MEGEKIVGKSQKNEVKQIKMSVTFFQKKSQLYKILLFVELQLSFLNFFGTAFCKKLTFSLFSGQKNVGVNYGAFSV